MGAVTNPGYLERVGILTLEQGRTVSKPGTGAFLQPTNLWGFPRYPDRTVILPPDADLVGALGAFIRSNTAFLAEANCWLGTWVHPETKHVYLDITASCRGVDEALRAVA